ncbi:efflux RND transporter periplasmic adaptor subunit [Brevundimonas sp.]|uniref:efflux RND transporter periplasmic adaptor subunit n=1 Tax=Brevundimonas sp. TaxID=1871086 RepID=UPI0024886EC0|nr:efflux RND transporter periplasmic adaptor subunit [Brevundimonas sp.]MDI1282221.1 efflux RND transporter periplasmic adaptor subunit [Brevundimonas sp.]
MKRPSLPRPSLPRLSLARWLWTATGLVLVIGLVWLAWPRPLRVEVAVIDHGPVRREIIDEGRTRIHDVFVISAPVAGNLQRIELHPGDPVSRGAVVATILPADPALLDARLAQEAAAVVTAARSALAAAEAGADLAQRDRTRVARLAAQGFAAPAALDGANAALRAARAEVSARQAELQRARIAAGGGATQPGIPTPVRSPASGRVLQLLRPSQGVVLIGTPLLELGDPANLEVVAEFLSQDAMLIPTGATAFLEGWGGETVLPARVSIIEPFAHTRISALGIEEQRVNVILHLSDPEAAPPLGHGFRLDVRVVVSETPNALRVPTDALVRNSTGWAVFRIIDGRARLTPIRIGTGDDRFRTLLEGLTAGERVILFPGDAIRDGSRVRGASGTGPAD